MKAQMTIGSTDWPTYLSLVSLFFVGGMIVLSIAEAYMFGREYAEGTAKNLLSLPIHRGHVVVAKLLVSAVGFAAMAVIVYAVALLGGFLIRLPGFSFALLGSNAVRSVWIVVEAMLVCSTSAWIV